MPDSASTTAPDRERTRNAVGSEVPLAVQARLARAVEVYRYFGLAVDNSVATAQAALSRESKS